MKGFGLAVLVVLGAALPSAAQAPRFDVASVKVSPRTSMEDGVPSGGPFVSPGDIRIMALSLRRILPAAFRWRGDRTAVRFDFGLRDAVGDAGRWRD
jgi:hypothetical protein